MPQQPISSFWSSLRTLITFKWIIYTPKSIGMLGVRGCFHVVSHTRQNGNYYWISSMRLNIQPTNQSKNDFPFCRGSGQVIKIYFLIIFDLVGHHTRTINLFFWAYYVYLFLRTILKSKTAWCRKRAFNTIELQMHKCETTNGIRHIYFLCFSLLLVMFTEINAKWHKYG